MWSGCKKPIQRALGPLAFPTITKVSGLLFETPATPAQFHRAGLPSPSKVDPHK
jgi:hypothetical protein